MRLLVVEDDVTLREALKKGLTGAGYAVDLAGDGHQGLWASTESRYDAIVLDIMLPGLNGNEVCARLRKAGNWTPVIMLTARDGEADETRSLDAGADDYLAKPFSFPVLLSRLRALARRGRDAQATVMDAGALRLDPASRRCWVAGAEVALTSREYSVIECLARKRGSVLSKLDILDNVWDFAFDGDPNIVEVYVRRLRSKLGMPRPGLTLTTVRGSGYRLDTES
jgi:DNA-binding response OmpR family regulator